MPGCTLPLENGGGRTGMSLLLFSPLGLSGYGCMPSLCWTQRGSIQAHVPIPQWLRFHFCCLRSISSFADQMSPVLAPKM